MGKLAMLAVIFALVLPMAALAQEYKTGERIEVLITNATDGRIVTGATCKMSVYNGTAIAVTNASMTDAADGNYYWAVAGLATQPTAPYRARVVCAVGGADWTTESLFGVVTTSYASWLSGIDSAIDGLPTSCGSGSSNITSCGTGSSNITSCGQGSSNLTVCGQGASNLTDAAVWAYASRTLTQNITQNVTDIWAAASRTLTQNITQNETAGLSAADVWAYATRDLTQNITQNLTAADIWGYATRALTQNITGNFSESGAAAAVWASASRTLTAFSFDVNVTQAALGNIATTVWASGTRTLTSFGSLVSDIATAVWGAVARTLTDFDDVWTVATRTLTQNITQNATGGSTTNQYNYTIYNTTATSYITDNSTFNIILPISD